MTFREAQLTYFYILRRDSGGIYSRMSLRTFNLDGSLNHCHRSRN